MQEFKKKIHGSGATTLIISNEKMNDIMKIVQTGEDSNILLKGVKRTVRAGEGIVRAGYGSSIKKKL